MSYARTFICLNTLLRFLESSDRIHPEKSRICLVLGGSHASWLDLKFRFVSRFLNENARSARILDVTSSPRRLSMIALAATLALAATASVIAGPQDRGPAESRDAYPRGRAEAGGCSLSDAIRRVQRSTGGQILGAEQVPFDGRNINRVKYMDERGRVRYMDDPAPDRAPPRAPRPAEPAPPPRSDNP